LAIAPFFNLVSFNNRLQFQGSPWSSANPVELDVPDICYINHPLAEIWVFD
jgi:hypothetical protein